MPSSPARRARRSARCAASPSWGLVVVAACGAEGLAACGADVLAIDAPFARRDGPPVRFDRRDRAEQDQLVADVRPDPDGRGWTLLQHPPGMPSTLVAEPPPFVSIAVHHTPEDQREAMVPFTHDVIAATEGAEGLVDVLEHGLPRIMALGEPRDPAWTDRDERSSSSPGAGPAS